MSADGVRASALAAAIPAASPRVIGGDALVRDLHHDSRDVTPGSGFVAIRGARWDGHDHVVGAAQAGAALVVVDHEVTVSCSQLVVDDTRSRMAALAAAVHGNPADELSTIGVTGTNGKTTVTHMLESILTAAGRVAGVVGTVGTRIAGDHVPQARTTPEATDLHRLLRRMVDAGVDVAALEVSSHALALGRADAIRFDITAFTNLSQDHLDFHKTMEEYFAAKALLFAADRTRHSVIWVDDPAGARLAAMTAGSITTVGFGSAGSHDVSGEIVGGGPDHTALSVHLGTEALSVRVPLAGRFNAANALLAAAVGDQLGLSNAAVVDGLERLDPVPGRFEHVPGAAGFSVVVDYAHTPEAVAKAIAAASEITAGRVIAVAGAAGDRDPEKRAPMGRAAATADVAIITSDNPRSENPRLLVERVLAGAGGPSNNVVAEVDRRKAIRRALAMATTGDMVLVLGKGHEPYQEIGNDVIDFDDRLVAAEELRALAGGRQ